MDRDGKVEDQKNGRDQQQHFGLLVRVELVASSMTLELARVARRAIVWYVLQVLVR